MNNKHPRAAIVVSAILALALLVACGGKTAPSSTPSIALTADFEVVTDPSFYSPEISGGTPEFYLRIYAKANGAPTAVYSCESGAFKSPVDGETSPICKYLERALDTTSTISWSPDNDTADGDLVSVWLTDGNAILARAVFVVSYGGYLLTYSLVPQDIYALRDKSDITTDGAPTIKLGASIKFTKSELQAAAATVRAQLSDATTTPTEILYDEETSDMWLKARGIVTPHGAARDDVCMLFSNSQSQPGWSWTLKLDRATGEWSIINSGY